MMRDRSWTTAGIGNIAFTALSEGLPASEVWSLLLDILARRAGQRAPADLLRQWERDGFTHPAYIDQRTLVELDRQLLAAAEAFEALELSPLAPLGTCSAVGPTSQNKIVSALRGTEVVADPTNVLALECGRRLRKYPRHIVRLATCHRCVRAQKVPNRPGFAPHFRIFCLATAGRERKDHAFVVEALVEQIRTHLAAFDRLEEQRYAFPQRRVQVLATPARVALGDRVAVALRDMSVGRGPLEHTYYDGLRFMINACSSSGDDIPLVDGGVFDWLGKVTSNRRLVLVASGMGSQLAAYLFRTRTHSV